MSGLSTSDGPSKARHHVSVTLMPPSCLAESMFRKGLQNQRAEYKLSFLVCPESAAINRGRGRNSAHYRELPCARAESRRIFKTAHFFWFMLHLQIPLESTESWASGGPFSQDLWLSPCDPGRLVGEIPAHSTQTFSFFSSFP